MQRILCFGDSNTWGFIPGTAMQRFGPDKRWPALLAADLAGRCQVIEEGLCGRTTSWDDPCWEDRNGSRQLPFLLESHMPLDRVIIMLGTNDLKHYLHLNAFDIALGAARLVQVVQDSDSGPAPGIPPKVLLIAPPQVVETQNPFGHKFDGAVERSQGFSAAFAEVASELGCDYLDASKLIKAPDTDGIHIDASGHTVLASSILPLLMADQASPMI